MGRKITAISSDLTERAKIDLKRIGSKGVVAGRLQAIISAKKHSIKKVCEVLDLSPGTINQWMSNYTKDGVKGLVNESKPPRSKLKEEHRMKLKEWIEEKPTSTLKELVLRCDLEFGMTIGKSSIHRELIKLGFCAHYREKKAL